MVPTTSLILSSPDISLLNRILLLCTEYFFILPSACALLPIKQNLVIGQKMNAGQKLANPYPSLGLLPPGTGRWGIEADTEAQGKRRSVFRLKQTQLSAHRP